MRKNILLGIRTMAKLPSDLHLVIVGRQTKYQKKLDAEIKRLGIGDRIHFLQGVPNDLLAAIYNQAEASSILHVMKDLVFLSSKPYKVDCQL